MRYRHPQLAGSDGTGHGRGHVPYDQAEVAFLFQQHLFIRHHDGGGLFSLGARAYFKIDVRIRDAQLLEEAPGHGTVVMLARMDQTKTQRTAPRLGRVERVDDRRNLHKIGPRPCDQINPLHGLASPRLASHACTLDNALVWFIWSVWLVWSIWFVLLLDPDKPHTKRTACWRRT
ncbi:MAG: hypothetical protein EWM73_03457 [Nitrospira sp.]|nr:MAG: hypothetical protein EWM73_03457 [Nitrospira sp.]